MTLRRMRLEIGPHGQPMDEAMSPDANPSVRGGYRYEVPLPKTDYAALALARAQDSYFKTYPEAQRSALQWRVRRVESPTQ